MSHAEPIQYHTFFKVQTNFQHHATHKTDCMLELVINCNWVGHSRAGMCSGTQYRRRYRPRHHTSRRSDTAPNGKGLRFQWSECPSHLDHFHPLHVFFHCLGQSHRFRTQPFGGYGRLRREAMGRHGSDFPTIRKPGLRGVRRSRCVLSRRANSCCSQGTLRNQSRQMPAG